MVYIYFHEGFDIRFWGMKVMSFLMECLCMAPLTPVLMLMTRFIFHPLLCRVLINGLHLVCL